jgi:hypothetical protein
MCRLECRIASGSFRNQLAQPADFGDVGTFGRLVQLPVQMQLCLSIRGAAAAFDDERRLPHVCLEVSKLGRDVAVIEVD